MSNIDFTAPEQAQFDIDFITSKEVCERMQIARSSLMHAYRRGTIPFPIQLNGGLVMIWHRTKLEPYLVAWAETLNEKRGIAA